ncbi:hypothetical protein AgCh_020332 [Apium graveolens]
MIGYGFFGSIINSASVADLNAASLTPTVDLNVAAVFLTSDVELNAGALSPLDAAFFFRSRFVNSPFGRLNFHSGDRYQNLSAEGRSDKDSS